VSEPYRLCYDSQPLGGALRPPPCGPSLAPNSSFPLPAAARGHTERGPVRGPCLRLWSTRSKPLAVAPDGSAATAAAHGPRPFGRYRSASPAGPSCAAPHAGGPAAVRARRSRTSPRRVRCSPSGRCADGAARSAAASSRVRIRALSRVRRGRAGAIGSGRPTAGFFPVALFGSALRCVAACDRAGRWRVLPVQLDRRRDDDEADRRNDSALPALQGSLAPFRTRGGVCVWLWLFLRVCVSPCGSPHDTPGCTATPTGADLEERRVPKHGVLAVPEGIPLVCAAHNTQPATRNVQHTTCDVQRATHTPPVQGQMWRA
jgi:hypothetical protein